MARRALKRFAIIVGSMAVAAAVGLIVYDLVEYRPHRREIGTLIASVPAGRNSQLLMQLQRADAQDQVTLLATRALLLELDRNSPRLTTLTYQRRELLWLLLVKIHLSEEERLLVVQRLAFFGTRSRGYEAGAREIFGRSVTGLSDLELAELVVIARWPRRYREPEDAGALRSKAQALLAECLNRS